MPPAVDVPPEASAGPNAVMSPSEYSGSCASISVEPASVSVLRKYVMNSSNVR